MPPRRQDRPDVQPSVGRRWATTDATATGRCLLVPLRPLQLLLLWLLILPPPPLLLCIIIVAVAVVVLASLGNASIVIVPDASTAASSNTPCFCGLHLVQLHVLLNTIVFLAFHLCLFICNVLKMLKL